MVLKPVVLESFCGELGGCRCSETRPSQAGERISRYCSHWGQRGSEPGGDFLVRRQLGAGRQGRDASRSVGQPTVWCEC